MIRQAKASLIVVVVVLPLFASVAAGQAVTGETAGQNETVTNIRVDGNVRVTGSSYDGGTFTVQLEADRPTSVVLADMAATGSVPTKQVRIAEGPNEVSMQVDTKGGQAGVSVSTSMTDIARVTESVGVSIFEGDPTWNMVRLALLAGVVSALLVVVYKAYNKKVADEAEARRIL
jgi:hypothetical protein